MDRTGPKVGGDHSVSEPATSRVTATRNERVDGDGTDGPDGSDDLSAGGESLDESTLTPDWWWDVSAAGLRDAVPTPERDTFPGPTVDWERKRDADGWFDRAGNDPLVTPERLVALTFLAALALGLLAVAGLLVPYPHHRELLFAVYVGVWVFVGMYVVASLAWGYEALLGRRYDPPDVEYGLDEIQVRILTVDAADVVQRTVDALPDGLVDRHVVAEAPIDVDGAAVHVVPDDFECDASDKGRALEWARRTLDCDREFVLFLDEDTLVTEFDGLPDADIVQFREWPMFTGSYLTYWSEVLRMGYQTEQQGFAKLGVPLYAWGGGIAVRESVEQQVTWDFDTLIEDTVFAWRAVREGASFEVLDTKFRNQAPPSIAAMFKQRRRWLVGSLRDEPHLPLHYQTLFVLRNVTWAFSPLTPFLLVFVGFDPIAVPWSDLLRVLAWGMFGYSFVWVWRGWRYYEGPSLRALPVFVCVPAVVVLHSVGAAWGFVSTPDGFDTTEKTTDDR